MVIKIQVAARKGGSVIDDEDEVLVVKNPKKVVVPADFDDDDEDEVPVAKPKKKKKKKKPAPDERAEAVVFLRGINNDTHANFKAWCAKRGKSMKQVFEAFMERMIRGEE